MTSQDEELRKLRRELARVTEERDILKSDGLLRQGIALRYAFVQEHLGFGHDVPRSLGVEGRVLRLAQASSERSKSA